MLVLALIWPLIVIWGVWRLAKSDLHKIDKIVFISLVLAVVIAFLPRS